MNSSSVHLLVLLYLQEGCETGEGSTYGVCFIDTSIGKFYVSDSGLSVVIRYSP